VARPAETFNLAWFLATCPVKACRDPAKAYRLAQQLRQPPLVDRPPVQLLLAAACNGLGRHDEAIALMEPLAKRAPDAAVDLWIQLAIAQHHLGRHEAACRALGRAAGRIRTWSQLLDLERQIVLAEVNRMLGEPESLLKLAPADETPRPGKKGSSPPVK
jgi:predicted Zn-dependent protease